MQLQLSTWHEVEAYLVRSTGIIIPIGSTEQHGPSGLIGTDAICPQTIARAVGEATGTLIGPTLSLGVAQFNLAFPGTVSVRARTLMDVIDDVVTSLARSGFTRLYFLNGHGGNIAPVRAAFQDLYGAWSERGRDCPFRCRLRSWWELATVDALRRTLYGAAEGLHATPSEVAITQFAHPDAIKPRPDQPSPLLPAQMLRERGGDQHFDAAEHRRAFPDGRVGSDPGLATAEHGRALVEAAAADCAADYAAFLAEA